MTRPTPTETLRYLAVCVLIAIGTAAIAASQRITSLFLFASPDGSVSPESFLELRLILAAMLPLGLALLFARPLLAVATRLDAALAALSTRDFIWRTLALAFLLRLLVVAFLPINLYSDYGDYDQLALTWAREGCYCSEGQFTGYWPPGYPFFLSRLYFLFGHAPIAGALANVFLSLATALLTHVLARRAFGKRAARWALVLMAFFPSQVLFVNLLASEMVFTPLFLLALVLVTRSESGAKLPAWIPLVAGGVALGLATLTRSLTQVFWLLLPPVWYLRHRSVSRTALNTVLVLIGMTVVLTPWIVRNQIRIGRPGVSLNGGINLMIGNHPGSGMGWNEVDPVEFNTKDPALEPYIDREGARRGWDYIKSDPVAFAKRGLLKVGYLYAGDMAAVWYDLTRAAERDRLDGFVALAFVSQVYYLILLLTGLLGLLRYFRHRPARGPTGYLLWVTIVFWTAVHFVFFGHARFHFPIMPVFCAFAALWFTSRTTVAEIQSRA